MPYLIGIAVLAAILPILWLVNARTPPPAHTQLGAVEGRLAACPESPNCVGSQSQDPRSHIEPLGFSGTPESANARIQAAIASFPRSRLARQTPDYLHFEFRSLVCRFVDDVEFLIDANAGVVHVRSASRLGYSDLGANRRRVEAIRKVWSTTGRP